MKVSIITVCYNSAETIGDTIRSVLSQTYPDIEYIIVDGLSADSTLSVIQPYKDKIARLVSEKDKGLYYAINKGLSLATGDIIGILHADDFYTDPSVIAEVVGKFKTQKTDTVYGDLQYVDRSDTNKIKRNWISGVYSKGNFLKGWMPPHPAFFAKKECYRKFGNFNTEFSSAADYELMLRFLYKNNCTAVYLPKILVKMRTGGKSNVSFLNRLKANREDKKAWDVNGLTPGMFTLIRKPLSKLTQFFS